MNSRLTIEKPATSSLSSQTQRSNKKDGDADFLQLVQNVADEVTGKATKMTRSSMHAQKQKTHGETVKKKQETADQQEFKASTVNAVTVFSSEATFSDRAHQAVNGEETESLPNHAASTREASSSTQGLQSDAIQIIDDYIASKNDVHDLTLMNGEEKSQITDSSSPRSPQGTLQTAASEEKYGDSALSTVAHARKNSTFLTTDSRSLWIRNYQPTTESIKQLSQRKGIRAGNEPSAPVASANQSTDAPSKEAQSTSKIATLSAAPKEAALDQVFQMGQWQGKRAGNEPSAPVASANQSTDAPSKEMQSALSATTKQAREQFSDGGTVSHSTIATRQMNRIALWQDYQATAQDAQSVPEQVADQMTKWLNNSSLQLGESGVKSMTMTLYPENLGTVTIMVTQDETGITASLSADTQSAKDILKSGIEQLQKNLISQGLPIHQIDVAHKNESAQQNQSSANSDQGQQQSRQGSQSEQERRRSQEQKRYSASRPDQLEERQDFHQLIIEGSV